MTASDAERIAQLERDNKELRRADIAVGLSFSRGGARPPSEVIVNYIEQQKDEFGVEPICAALSSAELSVAPNTYYAAVTQPPSARVVRDAGLKVVIAKVRNDIYGVYGIARCTPSSSANRYSLTPSPSPGAPPHFPVIASAGTSHSRREASAPGRVRSRP